MDKTRSYLVPVSVGFIFSMKHWIKSCAETEEEIVQELGREWQRFETAV